MEGKVLAILLNLLSAGCLAAMQFGAGLKFPSLWSWLALACSLNLLLGFRFLQHDREKKYDIWAFIRYLALIGNYIAICMVFVGHSMQGFSPFVIMLFLTFFSAVHMLHNLKPVKRVPESVSKADEDYIRRVLLGMLWALGPADYSILEVIKIHKENDEAHTGTSKGSANDALYSWCVKVGLAESVPLKIKPTPGAEEMFKSSRTYRLTPKGREIIFALMSLNPRTAKIPADAIVIKETEEILKANVAMGRPGSSERLEGLYTASEKPWLPN